MRKFVLALAVSAAFATPAMAEDFSGPYIGTGVTLDNVQGSGDFEGLGVSGLGATAFAGYDISLGTSVFVGVEANADLNTADVEGVEADWGWGVGARAGVKLNPSTALFARLGYARNRVSIDDVSGWGDGVRYGAGVQTALTDKVSLRAEVSQFNYEQDLINNQATLSLSYGF